MELPKINRDEVDFTNDSEVCNVGYLEGIYDNRPYRIEVWSSYGIDVATMFISNTNLKEENIKNYIVGTGVIELIEDEMKIDIVEAEDNEFYSINIPLRDKGKVYAKLKVDLKSYDI